MAYSKLGNIKGPQGRRGLNMTGGTTPPTVGEDVLEGDLWLDSTTGDVYRASAPDPWKKDGTWNEWGTVLWKVADNTLMVQPAEGDTGTTGEPADFNYSQCAPWCSTSDNPYAESMTSVRSKGNVVVGENSGAMFFYNKSLTDLSAVSNWNVSGVTDMYGMFFNCTSLANLSALSGWDTSGVTSIEAMFFGCTSLTDLSPISGWDVSGVTAMTNMFSSCTSLTNISALSGWNVSSVTAMTNMFGGCSALTDLSALSGWDTSGVTNMSTMFSDCTSLTDISALSGWDVSGVEDAYQMFSGCTSLTDISALSGWDVSGVTSMVFMFLNCPLERIGIPSLEHGGKKFVSHFKNSYAVSTMETTMFTNTTTGESMSANQILTDMDTNPSKYATGTIWTIARA